MAEEIFKTISDYLKKKIPPEERGENIIEETGKDE